MRPANRLQRLVYLAAILVGLAQGRVAVAADETSALYELHIPGQSLDGALQEFARQSGMQLVYRSRVVKGRTGPTLEGRYTMTAALDALLADSDLTFRALNDDTIEVRRASRNQQRRSSEALTRAAAGQASGARPAEERPEEVIVTATAQGVVAMRIETPLREIPQTVSLVTPAQIRVQNLTDVYDALDRVPGLVFAKDRPSERIFLSRGYTVTSFHVDGSANGFSYRFPYRRVPDLALFERIEVLRGADGLFAGNGQPGASINLIRKRPQHDPLLRVDAWAGSWNNYRVEVDATGPLAFDGALRGRMVAVSHDQDSFFDALPSNKELLFGVLDFDAGPTTLVTLGVSHSWSDEVPVVRGVPATSLDGTLPQLPRNMALATNWSFDRRRSLESYLQLQQALGQQWQFRFGATLWDGEMELGQAGITVRIDRNARRRTATMDSWEFTNRPTHVRQLTTDFTLTGDFQIFALRTQLALGADYGHYESDRDENGAFVANPIVDVRDFRPSLYPDPRLMGELADYKSKSHDVSESLGAFVVAKIYLTDSLSISAGARAGTERFRGFSVFNSDALGNFNIANDSYRNSGVPWSATVLTPYGAVMYDLSDNYSLYASYADIYRNPETDLYNLGFTNDAPGGPRLRADGSRIGVRHGVNIEAGIKAAWLDGAVNGTLVGYAIRQYRVPLSLSSVGLSGSSASGTSRSMGADLELSGTFGNWLLGGGYTFNEGRAATGLWNGIRGPLYLVKELSRDTPRHLLKAWLDKQLTGRLSQWRVGGNLRAQTSQIRSESTCANPGPGACGLIANARFEYNQYALVDLRTSFEIDPHWRVGLTVNNAFDKRYYESGGISYSGYWVGEPRNVMFKVEGTFGRNQ